MGRRRFRAAQRAAARGHLEQPPQRDGRHWGNASFYGGYSGCPGTAGWKAIDITGLGQGWSSNGAPSPEALALLAPNEADSYQWKKFASVNTSTPPYIAVTYNSPATPSAPLNVSATAGNASAWSIGPRPPPVAPRPSTPT